MCVIPSRGLFDYPKFLPSGKQCFDIVQKNTKNLNICHLYGGYTTIFAVSTLFHWDSLSNSSSFKSSHYDL